MREDVMTTSNFFQYEAFLFQYGYYFFMITNVFESGDEGGIVYLLDVMNPEAFVISITLLRVKPDHPLFDKISAYQKQRLRSIFRSKGLRPRRR